MRLVIGLLAAAALTTSGCGAAPPAPASPSAPTPTASASDGPVTQEEAQARLDAAADRLVAAGTGSYKVTFPYLPDELAGTSHSMSGSWDLNSGAIAGSIEFAVDGEGRQRLESRVVDEETYFRVTSTENSAGCWLKLDPAAMTKLLGGVDTFTGIRAVDSQYLQALMDPVATAVQGNADGSLKMDVPTPLATSMFAPKLARILTADGRLDAEEPMMVPLDVVLTRDGMYDQVTIDLVFVGVRLGKTVQLDAEEGALFSSLGSYAVIDYADFGSPSKIAAPKRFVAVEIGDDIPARC